MGFIIVLVSVLAFSSLALAAGKLNMYNWGNYTNPELIKKFEAKFDVKVTITDYDSNPTALAKVKASGHGFDMVVPSANYEKIFIEEGLALEVRPDQMENFKYVAPEWRNPAWDPGRRYSVPWQWGTVGMLDPESPVIQYVPEVADSAYGDCTVRHVLDMTVSSSFSEEYLDLSGDYGRYRRATPWNPALPGEDPGTLHGLLATLSPAPEPHGEIFNLCNLI